MERQDVFNRSIKIDSSKKVEVVFKILKDVIDYFHKLYDEGNLNEEAKEVYLNVRSLVDVLDGFKNPIHVWEGHCYCGACAFSWDEIVNIPIHRLAPFNLTCPTCGNEALDIEE